MSFTPCGRSIYCGHPSAHELRFVLQARSDTTASNGIRVPRPGVLPPASFRPCLAAGAPALS